MQTQKPESKDIQLQEVEELEEEVKEPMEASNQRSEEENVELELEEKDLEFRRKKEFKEDINNQWTGQEDQVLKIRDEFMDSINNSALMEAEKIQRDNILSAQGSPTKFVGSGETPQEVHSEDDQIKEHK
jgi:hypothetical protein